MPEAVVMNLANLFKPEAQRRQALAEAQVVSSPERCVQCGICSFNCPINIDVRRHAWSGKPILDSRCLTCGECVQRCPRSVLRFERTNLFA
jgi:NAD-dependent dihydropyrimidine dehydrogenase PreA subunit